MKLQDNLYTLQSADTETRSFIIRLNPDCIIYKAHFPGMPITPGVCIIGIATELLHKLIGRVVSLKEIVNAKFIATINPIERPQVTVTFNKVVFEEESSTVKINAVISAESTVCSKLSLLYNIK